MIQVPSKHKSLVWNKKISEAVVCGMLLLKSTTTYAKEDILQPASIGKTSEVNNRKE